MCSGGAHGPGLQPRGLAYLACCRCDRRQLHGLHRLQPRGSKTFVRISFGGAVYRLVIGKQTYSADEANTTGEATGVTVLMFGGNLRGPPVLLRRHRPRGAQCFRHLLLLHRPPGLHGLRHFPLLARGVRRGRQGCTLCWAFHPRNWRAASASGGSWSLCSLRSGW